VTFPWHNEGLRRRQAWDHNGGGARIFIYSCSQTIKTIDFKRS
jgi:hypothetical protein